MNLLSRFIEVQREGANSVTVRDEFYREVARAPRVKEHAFGLFPAGFRRSLTQISEELIQIRGGKLSLTVGTGLQRLRIKLCIENDCSTWPTEAYVGLHPRHEGQGVSVWADKLPLENRGTDVPVSGELALIKIEDEFLKER